MSVRDKDQYLVKAITAWKGDPNKRSRWRRNVISYKADLVVNEQYLSS